MKIFEHYARYYNLLYQDKDYSGEADYVARLLQEYEPGIDTVLDIGCGTGLHAERLAEKGFHVHGIDQSAEMLEVAEHRRASAPREIRERLGFSVGDARNFDLDRKFDAVTALFHVMSYQTSNADLVGTLESVQRHLQDNGLFLFDCWYGPAVLTQRPETRIKQLEDEAIRVVRIAEPVMLWNRDVVEVNYRVFVIDKESGATDEITEQHSMRYLFSPEVEYLLDGAGFDVLDAFEYGSGAQPGPSTWGVCFIARKKACRSNGRNVSR